MIQHMFQGYMVIAKDNNVCIENCKKKMENCIYFLFQNIITIYKFFNIYHKDDTY